MEILITHGWSEQNAGDYAIEHAILDVVDAVTGGNNHFTFYSLFDRADPRLKAHNTLKSQRDDIRVMPSLWGTPPIQYSRARKMLYVLKSLFRAIFIIISLRSGFTGSKRISAFKKADLVVVKGGTFIYTIPGLRGMIFGFRILLPIIIATMLQKKTIVAPHSFGPFNNKLMDPLIFRYLKKLDWIFCREEESLHFLKSKGIEHTSFLPDMAFFNKGYPGLKHDRLTIGITARPLDFVQRNRKTIYKDYLDAITYYIETITEKHPQVEVRLIPQVIGPDPREDDTLALKEIFNCLSVQAQSRTVLIEGKLRQPDELIKLYSGLDILIGTRMHSIIFGLLSGVKPIAIAYLGPKHSGIMNSFGLSTYVTSIVSIDKDFLVTNTEKLLDTDLSADILEKAGIYRQMIFDEFTKHIG